VTRVGAVDCGTNTVRLLVADLDPVSGVAHELVREVRIVRLGQDVDRTGRFADEALARVFAAAEEYAGLLAAHGAEAVRVCATSAARDVGNAERFLDGMRQRLGVAPEIVSGDEEAALTFAGATRALAARPGDAPVLVVDVGGGSTELVLGDAGGTVHAARSLDVGSVRVTERVMPSDPPTAAEVTAATRMVDGALDELPGHGVRLEEARTCVGVAGTVTNLAFVHLGLAEYDRDRVHHSRLPATDLHELTGRLLAMTVEQRVALGIEPGRADVIAAGALILDRSVRRSGVPEVLVSESDILDGIAWSRA
jgi:exopolyphosphatase / guanosine-5'-triphosphate,3'-diphosphate pyrophosphatase